MLATIAPKIDGLPAGDEHFVMAASGLNDTG